MRLVDYVHMFARQLPQCCQAISLAIIVDVLEYEHGCGHVIAKCDIHAMHQMYHFGMGLNYHCQHSISEEADIYIYPKGSFT